MAAGKVRIYRTYQFIDKDPVIDQIRTVVQENGLIKKHKIVSELSGVSPSTIHNWFEGSTRRPQHATVAAVITALGYDIQFVKAKNVNVEKEREKAASWLLKQGKKG